MSLNIINYKNTNWIKYQGTLIPFEAPNTDIQISKHEAKELNKKHSIYFTRWTSNWDCKEETDFWYVIKDKKEDLADYKSKVRNQIKKALSHCEVEKVDKEFIANNCYNVYLSAFDSYAALTKPMSENDFISDIKNDTEVGIEYWVVLHKETKQVIAYAKNRIQNNMVNYAVMKFEPKSMREYYSSYALIHIMNTYYLEKYDFVSDGARSVSHDSNIQDFLIQKFQFRKAYCKLHVVFSAKLSFILFFIYPFRKILYKMNKPSAIKKINVLLKHKEISR